MYALNERVCKSITVLHKRLAHGIHGDVEYAVRRITFFSTALVRTSYSVDDK